ncbi:hypothetical protein LJR220_003384 [Bradyrhizobium sp. LjRoot220]|uniref:hypothetical protein n=1 Tax=Bradyrhizobium sp. LjRoot220 TaxID=3342284 RepID=UPI003ECC22AB
MPIAAANAQGDASCCSEKALEYRKIMMPVQRALDMAYRAGICRLRSEHYFRTLSDSAMRYAMQESRRIGITNAEMSAADAAAKAILADEAKAAGNEDILKSCPHLARDPRLLQLDQLRSEILGNYH